MPRYHSRSHTWLVAVLMAGVILYGSFYPFDLRIPPSGIGPVATFIASIGDRPGRGDFIANILLYLPFGFFFVLSFTATRRRTAVPLAVLCGALISLPVELTQYYDAGRVTAFSDFYTNVLGSLLGALAALVIGARFRIPYVGEVTAQPIPTLLIIAWLAYRLYPYVPTIDLHKYWNALKPIVLTPSLVPYDLFRETAIWLCLYALIEAIVGRRRSAWLALLFAVCVLFAKILIVGTVLRLAEPAGAALAFILWLGALLLPPRGRFAVAGLVVSAYVVALRLEPFQFELVPRDFGWIPFYGLMHGSLHVDALSFLEKFFLYGSMIFLLGSAIRSRFVATVCVTLLLFGTSWAETYLPARSAEITDAVMAILIGVVFALLPSEEAATPPRGMSLSAREKRMRDWQRAQARALGVKVEE